MDPGNIVWVLALLIGAVLVVIVLLRIMKARRVGEGRTAPPSGAAAHATPEEEEYLDSSHILPGGSEAAARAAEAMRKAKDKRA